MTWFAVDDRFHQHPKVLQLRSDEAYAAALAMWLLAGSWAAGEVKSNLTGFIPDYVALTFAVPEWETAAEALVGVGLWEHVEGGYVFHDWEMWNGPDAQSKRAEARARNDRIRQRKSRAKRRNKSDDSVSTDDAPSVPVPSRPDPSRMSHDRHATDAESGQVELSSVPHRDACPCSDCYAARMATWDVAVRS